MKLIRYDPSAFHEKGSYFNPDDDVPPRCNVCGSHDILFGFKEEDIFRRYEQSGLSQHKPERFWYCKDCSYQSLGSAKYSHADLYSSSETIEKSHWDHRNLLTGARDWWFISHMNQEPDGSIAYQISKNLVRAGFRVWVDDFEMQRKEVRDAPDSSLIWALECCRGAILLTSDEYFSREWCMAELRYLLLLKKRRSSIDLVELRLPWSTLDRNDSLQDITLLNPEDESDCANSLLRYLHDRVNNSKVYPKAIVLRR